MFGWLFGRGRNNAMHDDTMINPDDIGSAEELRDLLVGLGFAEVRIVDKGSHINSEIDRLGRFACSCQSMGKWIGITVLQTNTLFLEYEYIDPNPHSDQWRWGMEFYGPVPGPLTKHQLREHIQAAAQKALDSASS